MALRVLRITTKRVLSETYEVDKISVYILFIVEAASYVT